MEHIVDIQNLVTSFPTENNRRTVVVNNVSIHVDRGEIVGLVGESGSGKSVTSMSMLNLIQYPGTCEGMVKVVGTEENVLELPKDSEAMRKVRGGRIGMIFQEPMTSLNPLMTVGKQIEENIETHLGIKGEEAKRRTIEIMTKVGIANPEIRYSQYPMEFSGGMRQRIMIAMVLAAEPDVIIADEATTALDVTTQAQVLELIQQLAREQNIAVIIVTHNLGLVARYTDRIYVMYAGEIVESADKYKMFENAIHPYTRGLLAAVPRLNDPKDRKLIPIEGLPPVPAKMPKYCHFYDRCPYHSDECKKQENSLKEYEPGHFVRCYFSQEELLSKRSSVEGIQEAAAERKVSDEICMEVEHLKMYFPLHSGLMKRRIGDVRALEDVSFYVRRGETLGIVGESGCGKSTLAKCIMTALKPTAGRILYHGENILDYDARQIKKLHSRIAMIFQDPFSSLDPRQSAGSIVGEPLKINKLVKTREEYNKRVNELFVTVGLDPSYRTRVPREFSGGQRQRLGIARALASEPDVIICDEPVSALDVSIQAQIINLLEELQAKLGITYLFIAHDLSVVKHISDRIVVMYLGRIVETADAVSLCENPLHPYTKALLSAVPISDPKADESRERIKLIGEIPSVLDRPSGCPFSARCQYASDRCRSEVPGLTKTADGHEVACFLYKEEENC